MFLVSTNDFILSFLPLCSVLVYHEYTNANIGSCWLGTRLKHFLNQWVQFLLSDP